MNLKKVRISKGISQNQLSKLSGVAQSTISYIESGEKSPSIRTVERLAGALNVKVQKLLSST